MVTDFPGERQVYWGLDLNRNWRTAPGARGPVLCALSPRAKPRAPSNDSMTIPSTLLLGRLIAGCGAPPRPPQTCLRTQPAPQKSQNSYPDQDQYDDRDQPDTDQR